MERRRGFHDSFIRFLVLFLVAAAAAALATAAAFAIRVLHLDRLGNLLRRGNVGQNAVGLGDVSATVLVAMARFLKLKVKECPPVLDYRPATEFHEAIAHRHSVPEVRSQRLILNVPQRSAATSSVPKDHLTRSL